MTLSAAVKTLYVSNQTAPTLSLTLYAQIYGHNNQYCIQTVVGVPVTALNISKIHNLSSICFSLHNRDLYQKCLKSWIHWCIFPVTCLYIWLCIMHTHIDMHIYTSIYMYVGIYVYDTHTHTHTAVYIYCVYIYV